jgi:hypothetical protein
MNRRGFAPVIILLIVAGLLLVGGIWYYKTHEALSLPMTPSTTPSQTSSNPTVINESNTTTAQSQGCTLLPYTGTVPLSQVSYYNPGDPDWRGGMDCKFIVNPNLPIFTFHFIGNSDNTLGNIEITEGTSSQIVQTIQEGAPGEYGISYDDTLTNATATLTLVDTNFDGYQDLQIRNDCGATGNCSYDFYLYNSSTNQFVHNSFLSNLGTPTFDAGKKQVMTSSNSSVADWEEDTYQYGGSGQYGLVRKVVSTWDRNNNVATVDTYGLQDGQMELINSTTSPVF